MQLLILDLQLVPLFGYNSCKLIWSNVPSTAFAWVSFVVITPPDVLIVGVRLAILYSLAFLTSPTIRSSLYLMCSNYSLFSKDKSLVFLYVRLRHRRILLLNYCLRLPRSVRSTQVREAEAALISVAVYGSAAASAPVFRWSPQTSAHHVCAAVLPLPAADATRSNLQLNPGFSS